MPPRRHGSAGYRGVRPRPSGRFSAEISHEGIRWYLGTFETAELAARVYDEAAWRLGRRPAAMNFDDVGSLEDADFVAPKFEFIDIDERERREAQRRQRRQRAASVIDEAAMDQLRRDHPELVRAELDFYAPRKKMKKTSDDAGPSNAAPPPAAVRADDEASHTSDFDTDYWNKFDDGSDDCSSEFN